MPKYVQDARFRDVGKSAQNKNSKLIFAKHNTHRTFNAIYHRSKGANSELATVQRFKSHCLPFILYGTEAVALTKSSVTMLDNCVNQAVIIKVRETESVTLIRQNCNLPYIGIVIQRHRSKFVNKLLEEPGSVTYLVR